MSLDVYLYGEETEKECSCPTCGHDHTRTVRDSLFSANITHNLNGMADEAGIYLYLWRPEEVGVTHARQLIEPLRAGLRRLESDEEDFAKFNPKNGWGSCDGLVAFVREYLRACEEYPDATVEVSR
jgi:hypothetical protein